jgi:hypothetical protein
MFQRFFELLPHLIDGTASQYCVVLFWAIVIVCVFSILRKFSKPK